LESDGGCDTASEVSTPISRTRSSPSKTSIGRINCISGNHALYLLGNHPEAFATPNLHVTINIVSSINTHKRGVVPVVVFGSEALDVADLDVDSLRFGPDGAATAHDLTGPFTWNEHLDDVNLDGFMDVMTHYRVDESGIAPGDESADLLGLTLDGRPLKGSGSIQTVGR
jgi:hypothetical protein